MVVYHGSNIVIEQPQLVPQNRFLDFGKGFYTTENKLQAISFADKVYRRRKEGSPIVSIYEIDERSAFTTCKLLKFDTPDEAWLDFVFQHRSGTYTGMVYDLTYGPVANDDIFVAFTLYAGGELTKEETINRLKVKKLFNQLVFSSERALSFLEFTGVLEKE